MNLTCFTENNSTKTDIVFAWQDNDEMVSKLYLTPHVTKSGEEVCYMNGFTTKSELRGQGLMEQLIREAFLCMKSEEEPFTLAGEENRELLTHYGFRMIQTGTEPVKMARIIDLKKLLMQVYSENVFVMSLKVIDERIEDNNGIFMLHSGPTGGYLKVVAIMDIDTDSNEHCVAECETTIEQLCDFTMGEGKAQDCFKVYAKSKEEDIMTALDKLKRNAISVS